MARRREMPRTLTQRASRSRETQGGGGLEREREGEIERERESLDNIRMAAGNCLHSGPRQNGD